MIHCSLNHTSNMLNRNSHRNARFMKNSNRTTKIKNRVLNMIDAVRTVYASWAVFCSHVIEKNPITSYVGPQV